MPKDKLKTGRTKRKDWVSNPHVNINSNRTKGKTDRLAKDRKNLALAKNLGLHTSEFDDGAVTVDRIVHRAKDEEEIDRQSELDNPDTDDRVMGATKDKEEDDRQKAEEARRAKEESDRLAEEARRAKEESDRLAEEARRAKEESDRQVEEAQRVKEVSDRLAEETQRAKEESDRQAAEAQRAKNALQQDISTRANADWGQLTATQQNEIVEEAYQSTSLSEEKRRNQRAVFYRRSKKSNAEQRNKDADSKLVTYIQELRGEAVKQAVTTAGVWAQQARARIRQTRLAEDQTLLRSYINNLNHPQDNANVKAILTKAVDQLGFSNYAFGSEITKAYSEADIQRAAYRWNRMNERVNNLQIVTDMHIPGGWNAPLSWKNRGENWEKTKNLVADADGVTNNVHLHTTSGGAGWQRPKSRYPMMPSD